VTASQTVAAGISAALRAVLAHLPGRRECLRPEAQSALIAALLRIYGAASEPPKYTVGQWVYARHTTCQWGRNGPREAVTIGRYQIASLTEIGGYRAYTMRGFPFVFKETDLFLREYSFETFTRRLVQGEPSATLSLAATA
jgi:hypothetical protein